MSDPNRRRYRMPYCIGDQLDRAKMANSDTMHTADGLLRQLERGQMPDRTDLINRLARIVRNTAENDRAIREVELIQALGKDQKGD